MVIVNKLSSPFFCRYLQRTQSCTVIILCMKISLTIVRVLDLFLYNY